MKEDYYKHIKKKIKQIDDELVYIDDLFPKIELTPGSMNSQPAFIKMMSISSITSPKYISPKEVIGTTRSRMSLFEAGLRKLINEIDFWGWKQELCDLESDLIEVFEFKGKYYVGEGHHRMIVAQALNIPKVKVRIKKIELKQDPYRYIHPLCPICKKELFLIKENNYRCDKCNNYVTI